MQFKLPTFYLETFFCGCVLTSHVQEHKCDANDHSIQLKIPLHLVLSAFFEVLFNGHLMKKNLHRLLIKRYIS